MNFSPAAFFSPIKMNGDWSCQAPKLPQKKRSFQVIQKLCPKNRLRLKIVFAKISAAALKSNVAPLTSHQ